MSLTKVIQIAAVLILLCTSAVAEEFDFTTVIPLRDEPSKIVISEEQEVAVVVSVTGQVLIVANIYKETIIHEILLPALPVDIIANPNSGQAIITAKDGSLLVYDLYSGELLKTFMTGRFAHFITIDKVNNIVFLGSDDGFRAVDIDSGNIIAELDLNEFPIQCFASETSITVISQDATAFHLRSIDSNTYETQKEVSYKGKIESAGLDDSRGVLLITLENIAGLLLFDNTTLDPVGLVPTDMAGKIVAVDTLRSKVFLVNQPEGSLMTVDLREERQEETIILPENFGPVAVSAEYNRAIVGLGKNLTFVQLVRERAINISDEQQYMAGDDGLSATNNSQERTKPSGSILPSPELLATKPDKVALGTPSFKLRILGKNFLPKSYVTVNGTDLSTKFLSSTVLEAQVDQNILRAEGNYPVTVTNVGEITQKSNTLLLSVIPGAAFPGENPNNDAPINYGSLTGRILNTSMAPVAGATIRTKKVSAITNANGEFVLSNVPAGKRTVFLDGSTAKDKDGHYPTIPITVEIIAGIINPLPFQPYFHRQKSYNFVDINPAAETVLTDPEVPGFEMKIPPGVDIIGWDGQRNHKVSVRTVPPDRLPVKPLPSNAYIRTVYMFYFDKIGGGMADRPIPISANNDLGLLPGEKAILWYYDESPNEGDAPNDWAIAGTGTVTPNGKYIVCDPGVGIPKFCCGATAWGGTSAPNQTTGKTNICVTSSTAGDPVDLATGYFLHEHTDLVVPGIIPIRIKRYYRSQESIDSEDQRTGLGAFGRGTYFEYDWWLDTYGGMLLLILPGNFQYRFDTMLQDGSYINTTDPAMRGMRVVGSGTNKILKMRNGWNYTFNSYGELAQIADRNTNTLTIERRHGFPIDFGGYITRIYTSDGNEVVFNQLNPSIFWQTNSIVGSNGITANYSYDNDPFSIYPRLSRVDLPDGSSISYGYDAQNRMNYITNGRGVNEVFNEYDANNRVTRQTHPDGGEYDFSYTAPANFVTETVMTSPNGASTSWRFNADGYITEKMTPDGLSLFEMEPDTNEVHTITDPLGRSTTYTYYDTLDATDGLPHTKTDTLGNVTTFEYETTYGLPTKITNALGKDTNISYTFSLGRLVRAEIRDPLQNLTAVDYDAYGMPITITDPNSNSTTLAYDAAHHSQLVAATDPLGHTVTYGYNSFGWLSAVTAPDGATALYEYDNAGRIKIVTNPEGSLTRYFYDPKGNLVWMLDPNRSQTFLGYDDRDRLTKVTDQLGRIETYSYYRDAEITATTGANLKTFTDRNGQVTTFNEYDPMGRLRLVTFDDLSTIQYSYDAGGRLVTINDSISGAINYTYNDFGCGVCSDIGLDRIAREATPPGTVDYTYDELGRRLTMTLTGSPVVEYAYDDASRLITVARLIDGITKNYNFEYDPGGRRTTQQVLLFREMNEDRYLSRAFSYDNASNLVNLLLGSAAGTLENYTLTYNENGHRKTLEITGELPQSGLLDSASFDAANEMLTHDDYDFTYDANGNLVYMFDTATQVGTVYTWDARSRLIGIASPEVNATFAYDALNRRAEKTINGVTTQYIYDGLNVIKEIRNPGQSTDFIHSLNIDEPLYLQKPDGTMRYYLADALGSVVALVDGGTGNVTTSYAYDPFGQVTVTGSDANPFQYTGRENDGTGLYYYRARYYSPTLRRFISEDPIGLAGGLNFYAYVQNNPVNWVDPWGLKGGTVGFEGTLAAFGFGGNIGIYGNYAHDDSQSWYQGWSSSVTVVAGGGAAASAYYGGAGVHLSGNNACEVKQLEGAFANFGRAGFGAGSINAYRSPDGSVTGAGVTIGPSIPNTYLFGTAGGSYTWSLGGGKW